MRYSDNRMNSFLGVILMAFLTMFGCSTLSTLPDSYHPNNPIIASEFSHDLFDKTLRAHVVDGNVNYPGYAADPRLTQYLKQLNRHGPDHAAEQQ